MTKALKKEYKDSDKRKVEKLALKLFLKLPFWERWSFYKWYERNNWDVKGIMQKCYEQAVNIIDGLEYAEIRHRNDN